MRAGKILATAIAVLCIPSVGLAGYGFDAVPGSSFSQGTWHFYGADQIPASAHHTAGLMNMYGVDRVPGEYSPASARHPHHELIAETIQHLTGAVEVTPARQQRSQPRPARTPQCAPRP